MIKISGDKSALLLFMALSLSACSTQKNSPNNERLHNEIGNAVTAPLSDLNLVQTAIPTSLRNAQKNPYAAPESVTCDVLAKEINALDEVLGADLDKPVSKKDEGLLERNLVSESVSAIRKTTESVVPFRNWVRKLSGAERKSSAVKSAITAGSIRRAYLKGIGQAHNCPAPASPQLMVNKN